jgi:hypothetical protein
VGNLKSLLRSSLPTPQIQHMIGEKEKIEAKKKGKNTKIIEKDN